MSDSLVFMMGKFEANFPTDRQYSKNHLWATRSGSAFRFGFSAYAVRLLQDVYFLEWQVDEGATIKEGQEIGFIESSKAESDLYPPMAGVLARLNPELMSDPSRINVDMYGEGWLYEIEGSGDTLLSPQEYIEHLASVWEVTQRTIKGQLNE
ncbi:glycine cleavage system protein H [Blastopirellula marina]|uniref:Glycine cleavage system protein H n=1 Tax=Blastopirellula marina TaxID=124 RepID=A0A2S8F8T2_9BACT|nr:glycine cleavage system protein H [Blastopirellula marina]PQO28334.1 glycine cleavage system protein H [Blastopirellula marina]PTL41874.1 glycine cleavage system protein H [Blastopirellula marina]